jgi:hypothetical protein
VYEQDVLLPGRPDRQSLDVLKQARDLDELVSETLGVWMGNVLVRCDAELWKEGRKEGQRGPCERAARKGGGRTRKSLGISGSAPVSHQPIAAVHR